MAEPRTTDEAMNTVLRAERDAKESVEKCQREADQSLVAARERARRIAEQADRRISHLHARCAADAGRRVQSMLRTRQVHETTLPLAVEQEILQAAVELLAAELTGEDRE